MKLLEFNKEENMIGNKTLNKKKVIISLIVLIIIITFIVISALYVTNLNFRDVIDQYVFKKNVVENKLNNIDINTETTSYMYGYDKSIVILEKNILTRYNSSGNKESELQIEISEPVFDADGKYLIIAEKNKQKVYLIHNNTVVWQKDMEGTVSKINVNKNGFTSIIISDTTYKSVIAVYDKTGKELFKTYLSSTIAIDSSISEDNKYMSFAEINTSGTLIQSTVKVVSIEKAKSAPADSIIYSYTAEPNDLIININYQQKDKLICLYSSGIHIIHNNKDEILTHLNEKDKKVTFADIELENFTYQIVEKSEGLFKTNSTVELYNTDNKKQNLYKFKGVTKRVYSYGSVIAVDLGTEVHFIGTNGWLIKKYNSSQEIKDIILTDGIAGILYRDKLEFIDL